MVAFMKKKKETKKVEVLADEKRVKDVYPDAYVKKSGIKIAIYSEKKGKLLSMDKRSIDNAWKKALHNIL